MVFEKQTLFVSGFVTFFKCVLETGEAPKWIGQEGLSRGDIRIWSHCWWSSRPCGPYCCCPHTPDVAGWTDSHSRQSWGLRNRHLKCRLLCKAPGHRQGLPHCRGAHKHKSHVINSSSVFLVLHFCNEYTYLACPKSSLKASRPLHREVEHKQTLALGTSFIFQHLPISKHSFILKP